MTNDHLKDIRTNASDVFNRESLKTALNKDTMFKSNRKTTKKENSKRKKNKEINLNFNLKVKIGNITNEKLTQNIKINKINEVIKTDRKEGKKTKHKQMKKPKTFRKEMNLNKEQKYVKQKRSSKPQIDITIPLAAQNSLKELYNPFDYYRRSMLRALKNKLIHGNKKDIYTSEIFFNHFKETYLHFNHLKMMGVRTKNLPLKKHHNLPFLHTKQKILILDLDETLVHVSFKKSSNEAIPFTFEGSNQQVVL